MDCLHIANRGFIHRVKQLGHALDVAGVVSDDQRVVAGVSRNRTILRQQWTQYINQVGGGVLLDLEDPGHNLVTLRTILRHHSITLHTCVSIGNYSVRTIDLHESETR